MKRVFSHPLTAIATGLCLRLLFVFQYPQNSGDTPLYEELATNWLKHHVFGTTLNGLLTPLDIRVPGYPAYLALVYALTGRSGEAARTFVMLGQTALDLFTCIVIAGMAAAIVPSVGVAWKPRSIFRAALWLAVTCPFAANYVAVPLTETFAIFFTAMAIFLTCLLFLRFRGRFASASDTKILSTAGVPLLSLLLGLSTGLGALFRPETPLLLVVVWLVAVPYLFFRGEIRHTVPLVLISGAACFLPLLPWGIRNITTLHEAQFLAPKYSNISGEPIPYGFMNWERTWLYRFRDVYLVSWNLDSEAIDVDQLPAYAFDTSEEKARVAAILEQYNEDQTLTREEDAAFGRIGAQRTARHPWRTYLYVPAMRFLTMWFTPRIEMLPFSGKVWPVSEAWEEDPVDFSFTIGFFLLNMFYVVLAVWGGVRLWWASRSARIVLVLFLAFIFIRTAFLTTLETPEPRYVLECFPIVLALGAFAFAGRPGPATTSLSVPPPAQGGS